MSADWNKCLKDLAKLRDHAIRECASSCGRESLFWNRVACKLGDVKEHVLEALDERNGRRRCTHVGDDTFGCGECSR